MYKIQTLKEGKDALVSCWRKAVEDHGDYVEKLGVQWTHIIILGELNDLYSSPNIVRVIKSKRMKWAGHVACMGEWRGVYRVLVGKPEGKRPLRRPRRRWKDNIKMDLQELGCGAVDWIELAQGRDRCWALVNAVMNIRVP